MTLHFKVADLQREREAFSAIAKRHLDSSATWVLAACGSQLSGIAKSSTGGRWMIEEDDPVVTTASIGQYMPDDKGMEILHAEMSFVWEIEPVRPSGDTRPAETVNLFGLGSTAIRICRGDPHDAADKDEVAFWRMEIADSKAPGCFFHVQVMGRDGDSAFPKSVDVPRLPGMLHSPFACMEFVLGELFQEEWHRLSQRTTSASRMWHGIQAARHQAHLRWVLDLVSSSSGSPWAVWKAAQPPEGLYMPSG